MAISSLEPSSVDCGHWLWIKQNTRMVGQKVLLSDAVSAQSKFVSEKTKYVTL